MSLALFVFEGAFAVLEEGFVLLGDAFHLSGLVEFDEVDRFEDAVHLLFVHLAVGVVAFALLFDLL